MSVLIATASAKSGSGGGGNVTGTVFDYDTSGALLLFRSDDYNGSNEATYVFIGQFYNSARIHVTNP